MRLSQNRRGRACGGCFYLSQVGDLSACNADWFPVSCSRETVRSLTEPPFCIQVSAQSLPIYLCGFLQKARICFRKEIEVFNNLCNAVPKAARLFFYVMDVEQVFTREFFLHVSHELQDLIIVLRSFGRRNIFLSGHFRGFALTGSSASFRKNFNRSNMSHYTDKKNSWQV